MLNHTIIGCAGPFEDEGSVQEEFDVATPFEQRRAVALARPEKPAAYSTDHGQQNGGSLDPSRSELRNQSAILGVVASP